ncbi:MAG: dihydroneopterin aldolase [Planctomycetota bacterium]
MRDTVYIRGLEIRSIIGIHAWERQERQTIRIDIEMAADTAKAAATESIEDALDYRAVAKAVIAHVEKSSYYLVETLAERLAELIRGEFGVPWVRLHVGKPGAVRFSEEVGVVIERGSRDGSSPPA